VSRQGRSDRLVIARKQLRALLNANRSAEEGTGLIAMSAPAARRSSRRAEREILDELVARLGRLM
jgi:hypothetical protein